MKAQIFLAVFGMTLKNFIPNFRRQPGNRSRLKCVYGFIMELVSFFFYYIKTNYDIITVQTAFDSALSDKCSHVLFIYFCRQHFGPFFT